MPELARRNETPLEIPPLKKKGAFSFKEHEEFYDDEIIDALDGRSLDQLEKWGDRYRVVKKIGEGGMGTVMLAVDEQVGRLVVIKRLHTDLVKYEHAVKRFMREIRALAHAKNPFIVKAHDVITFPLPYGEGVDLGLVMEYVKGKDLFDTLKEERFFDEKRAAEIAIQICFALSGAHEKGMVHRDLKPENIFLDDAGHVRVGDFGIAGLTLPELYRPSDYTEFYRGPLTASGTVFGTPEYLSPEAGRGERVDGRSDLYAVGIIMYCMLAGHLPFRGGKPELLIQRQISETPKPFSDLAAMPEPNKNTVFEPIVMKLLAKDPKERYQTAFEIAQAIKEVIVEKYPELLHREPFDLVPLYEEKKVAQAQKRGVNEQHVLY